MQLHFTATVVCVKCSFSPVGPTFFLVDTAAVGNLLLSCGDGKAIRPVFTPQSETQFHFPLLLSSKREKMRCRGTKSQADTSPPVGTLKLADVTSLH